MTRTNNLVDSQCANRTNGAIPARLGRYHRVVASVPIDKTAALVTGGGVHYNTPEKRRPTGAYQEKPPLARVPWGCPDLTGTRFGNFTVEGYLGSHKKKGSTWLIRCVCGNFETRHTQAIKRAAALDIRTAKRSATQGLQCWECTNLASLRRLGAQQ